MTIGAFRSFSAALLAGMLIMAGERADAASKTASRAAAADSSPIQILPGASSKEPISIDADKLVYYDKEKKAVYSGNVVVVQGDTKMTCSVMTVFLDRSPAPGGTPAEGAKGGPSGGSSSPGSGLKRMEASGPVTVISKSQVATGDNAIYDKLENKVQLIGHVTLSDGQNTTKGDKLTYDLKTSQATIDAAGSKSSRVHGQFVPNAAANPLEAAKPK